MANLEEIVQQLTEERDRMDRAIEALSGLSGGKSATRHQPGGRTMSAAARARISVAQKARWARSKRQQKVVPIASRGKRHISAAGRARIAAAARARWAKVRATKKG
jgi:hypothetical protein